MSDQPEAYGRIFRQLHVSVQTTKHKFTLRIPSATNIWIFLEHQNCCQKPKLNIHHGIINHTPPQLTEEEWRLLHEHDRCLKCQEFYISHCANVCTVTLNGNSYKTCTLQDALQAKATCGSSHPAAPPQPVAAITKMTPTEKMTKLVAAVFPQNTHVSADISPNSRSVLVSVNHHATLPLGCYTLIKPQVNTTNNLPDPQISPCCSP